MTLGVVQLVVNPRSGNGTAHRLAQRLETRLRAAGHHARTLVSESPAEARARLTGRDGGDVRCLVGIGGDDTLSETAQVALELGVPLLPVPAGFGNVFAHAFGHRPSVSSVLRVLDAGCLQRIDAGTSNGHLFLAAEGFGFLEDVKRRVEAAPSLPRRGPLRYLAYVHTALQTVARRPLPALRVALDGEPVADAAVMAIVANVPTYRGFLLVTPWATPLDGLLDVFIVPSMSKGALVALLLAFLVQAPGRWRRVLHRRASHVSLTGADGVERELRVLPAAVPLLVPPARRRRLGRALGRRTAAERTEPFRPR